jgi:hypothetical protein
VSGNAQLQGDAVVNGDAVVGGDAHIQGGTHSGSGEQPTGESEALGVLEPLLAETQTISQWMKAQDKLTMKKEKEYWTRFVDRELGNLPDKMRQVLARWLVAHNKLTDKSGYEAYMDADYRLFRRLFKEQGGGDFLAANINNNKLISQLNTFEYTPEDLRKDAESWHEELARKESGKGPEGREVLDLASIGWPGWAWVSLDCASSSEEGKAMGHCGNAYSDNENDNILSLRDEENYPHLTFVVADGVLGEMKGRANTKPAKKYHPAIIALLKSDLVRSVKGGGYDPESNFDLQDLEADELRELKKIKPGIDYLEFVVNNVWGDVNKFEDVFGMKPDGFEGEVMVVATAGSLDELYELITDSFVSVGTQPVQDFRQFDSLEYQTQMTYNDLLSFFDSDLLTDEEEAKIHELLKPLFDKLDTDDVIEVLKEEQGEVLAAIYAAYTRAEATGAENEAWKDIQNQLGSSENGYQIDFSSHPWRLTITKSAFRALVSSFEEYDGVFTTAEGEEVFSAPALGFAYSIPYYDYQGFDELAFHEILADELGQVKPMEQPALEPDLISGEE